MNLLQNSKNVSGIRFNSFLGTLLWFASCFCLRTGPGRLWGWTFTSSGFGCNLISVFWNEEEEWRRGWKEEGEWEKRREERGSWDVAYLLSSYVDDSECLWIKFDTHASHVRVIGKVEGAIEVVVRRERRRSRRLSSLDAFSSRPNLSQNSTYASTYAILRGQRKRKELSRIYLWKSLGRIQRRSLWKRTEELWEDCSCFWEKEDHAV